jgi:hypothetical protein
MNPAQARVVDPILSAVARGYLSPSAGVANVLFPFVDVGQRGGRIIKFGPDAFKLVGTSRAPGAGTRRVQFAYSDDPYALTDYGLEGVVPVELQQEADAVPGIDLGNNAVRTVQNLMALERENKAAVLATTAASYASSNKATLASTAQWSHADSTPAVAVAGAKEAIRQQIGVRPNVLVVGPQVLSALKVNPSLLDLISDNEDKLLRTEQIARLLEVDQVIEGDAVYHDGTKFVDVWGKYALLAYTTPKSLQEMGSPSYGYTYRLTGYPQVEEPYFERNPKSWMYPVTDAYQPVLAGPSAGFLWTSAVA